MSITTSGENVDRKAAENFNISGYIIKPLRSNSSSTMEAFDLMIYLINFKSLE